jgi:signal transduction histidine kinase
MRSAPRDRAAPLRLWRTTPFRLTAIYGVVFAAGIMALLGLIYLSAAGYLTRQMDQIVLGETRALSAGRAETLPDRIIEAEAADERQVNYYGLFSAEGVWIAGNVRDMPPKLPIDGTPRPLVGRRFQPGARGLATRLPWGEVLVVGFDAKVLSELRHIIVESLMVSGGVILVLGLALGAAMSLGPLRRIRDVQRASEPILDGDLSARLPVSARGDEIDILAHISNTRLAEVERLLGEVQNVGNNVAHDLRTPLNRLRALLYRAGQGFDEGDPRRSMLQQALKETDSLLSRFRAIQRIAEIDRRGRRAGFAEVDLASLLQDVAELYEPLAEDAGQTLTVALSPARRIQADRELLFEALSNLVANAIKFTPSDGRLWLGLRTTPDGPRIEVVDSGPGVPEAERDAVLQRFYRMGRDEPVEGSGLGLSMVAAVVRLHEFRLTLDDANPGLRVAIDAWRQTRSAQPAALGQSRPRPVRVRPRILGRIVDPDAAS